MFVFPSILRRYVSDVFVNCFWYEQEKKQVEGEAEERVNKQLALEAAQADMARDLSNEVSKSKKPFFGAVALFQAIDYSSSV